MTEKDTYIVTVPMAGCIHITVAAHSEQDAKERAMGAGFRLTLAQGSEESTEAGAELGEFELLEHISQGNVLYAPINEIEIEKEST